MNSERSKQQSENAVQRVAPHSCVELVANFPHIALFALKSTRLFYDDDDDDGWWWWVFFINLSVIFFPSLHNISHMITRQLFHYVRDFMPHFTFLLLFCAFSFFVSFPNEPIRAQRWLHSTKTNYFAWSRCSCCCCCIDKVSWFRFLTMLSLIFGALSYGSVGLIVMSLNYSSHTSY